MVESKKNLKEDFIGDLFFLKNPYKLILYLIHEI